LADAIQYHHEHVEKITDAFPLVKIVFIANALCHEDAGDGLVNADLLFGLKAETVEALISKAKIEAAEVAQSFGIKIESSSDTEAAETEKDAPPRHEKKLLSEIKNYSLLYGTLQNLLKADGRDAIIKIIEGSLRILFEVKNNFFFFYEPENNLLVGYSPPGSVYDKIINGLVIPFSNDKSLIVKCLTERSIMDSFGLLTNESRNIADDQIIGLLSTQGMICRGRQ